MIEPTNQLSYYESHCIYSYLNIFGGRYLEVFGNGLFHQHDHPARYLCLSIQLSWKSSTRSSSNSTTINANKIECQKLLDRSNFI